MRQSASNYRRRVKVAIVDHGLRVIVYDPTQEVIEQWIN
jgi:hypothetical protein